MATVEGIRARLKDSFTEQQADVLAHVVVEAHADYVTRGDFQALTSPCHFRLGEQIFRFVIP